MRINIWLFAALMFLHLSGTSQTEMKEPEVRPKYRGYFMFGLGSAIPKGNLALQDVSNDKAGLAKNGLDFRFSFGYLFHENFGVCVAYYGQAFKVNAQAMADYYAKQSPGVSYSVQVTQGWGLGGALVGIYGKLPIDEKKKFFLEPRFMFGYSTGQSPEYSVTAYLTGNGYTQSAKAVQSSDASQAVGTYIIGGTLKMELGNRFCMGFNVDYMGLLSDTYYNDVTITYSSNGNGYNNGLTEKTEFWMEMKSVTISAGIGVRFGKRKMFE